MHTYLWKLAAIAAACALPFTCAALDLTAHAHGQSATLAEHQPDNVQDARNLVSVRRYNQRGTVIRNNIGAFKFELPGGLTADLTRAELSFALFAATGPHTAEINVYGLRKDAARGAVTAGNWSEKTITFNTMPGLLPADGNLRNPAINPADTVLLGTITVPANAPAMTKVSLTDAALRNYLEANGSGAVTFLLEMRAVGAERDENVQLLSGQRSSPGGGFYPTLTLNGDSVDGVAADGAITSSTGVSPEHAYAHRTATFARQDANPAKGQFWPSIIDETTGRRVYQLTTRPGHNMSFYYLFHNAGSVDGVPYLVYRNQGQGGATYYSINLDTGAEVELTERGMVGTIGEVAGEYLYCLKKAQRGDASYAYIIRSNLKTGEEETLFELDTAYRYSANLAVSPDGSKVLFIRPKAKGEIDLLCGLVADGSQRIIASGKMSHINFGPVNPDLYIYIDQNYGRNWRRAGIGWVDLENDIIFNESLKTSDAFFDRTQGHLIPSHLHWDTAGNPVITAVDTSRPYIDEYNVVIEPDKNNPGELLSYRKAQIRMGQFQTHFNPGPSPSEWVGDGMSADWWHKPGFGKPYIHKVTYDYGDESMVQTPLADQVGVYWKSGPLEANARYMPGKDWVIWSSFRTLEGRMPDFLTEEQIKTGSWDESLEPSQLYGPGNTVMQNVFAVAYSDEDRTGWDFVTDREGWSAGNGATLAWTDGGGDDAAITGKVSRSNAVLLSPDNIDLPCADFDHLMIRMQNNSPATQCKVYYTTDRSPSFSEDKSATVSITPSTKEFRSYFVPLAKTKGWQGTLRQLKIEPLSDADSGSYTIPVIRLVKSDGIQGRL